MKYIFIFIGKMCFYIQKIYLKFIHIYLMNYYTNKIKKVGKCVRFNGVSFISGLENIEIGNNVHIGNNAWIKGEGGLYIGNNTHISRNLVLYTVNHNYNGELLPYDNTSINKKVIIEKNVWIGMNVVILPGTHIEEGCIIGAGAVVAGRIKKCSIYGASLGKIINKRDEEHYDSLNKNKKFGGINGNKIYENCI